MRILVHDFSGHPFQVQLSRELARRGHEVVHVYCPSYTSGKGPVKERPSDPASFRVLAIETPGEFATHSVIRRLVQEAVYGSRVARVIRQVRPDTILSCNGGLLAQRLIQAQARRRDATFVFWMQDITSASAMEFARARFGKIATALSRITARVERTLVRRSDTVIPIGEAMTNELMRWGVKAHRCVQIRNWAPIDELPTVAKANEWSELHDLANRFVFLYAGTLGLKHHGRLLLDLAGAVPPEDRVVVVSQGPQADALARVAEERSLSTLMMLPFQSYETLPFVMGTADVLLALLTEEAARFSEPSKVLSYLCAERAILGAIPVNMRAAQWLQQNCCARIVDSTEDSATVRKNFVREALALRSDRESRAALAAAGRRLAESEFRIAAIGNTFELALGGVSQMTVDGASRS